MYYVGDSETLYRDYMITNDLRDADIASWTAALNDAMTVVNGNTRYLKTDIRLSSLSVG
jgi:hypothetical protein